MEQSRVEIAVLLNELAYLKYEAPQDTSATAEAIFLKRRSVAVAYSLVEKIIKLISNVGGNDGILKEIQFTYSNSIVLCSNSFRLAFNCGHMMCALSHITMVNIISFRLASIVSSSFGTYVGGITKLLRNYQVILRDFHFTLCTFWLY